MLILLVFAFGIGMPETYGREIARRRNRARGLPPPAQPLAESGVTIGQMVTVTVVNPLKQLFLEPLVAMVCFALALDWAVTFQWFITVRSCCRPCTASAPSARVWRSSLRLAALRSRLRARLPWSRLCTGAPAGPWLSRSGFSRPCMAA